jgi:hypothetical protein
MAYEETLQNKQPSEILDHYTKMVGVQTKEWWPATRPNQTDWKHQQMAVIIRQGVRKYLEQTVSQMPNSPFVELEGIGYIRVPPETVSALSQPGVFFGGQTFGITSISEDLQYLLNFGIDMASLGTAIKWFGSAHEAVERLHK